MAAASDRDRTHDVQPWEVAAYIVTIAAVLLASYVWPMGFAS